jgi:hypothetical protein
MGTSQVPQALRAFILGELADADWFSTERSEQDTEAARRHAAGFFREALNPMARDRNRSRRLV